MTVQLEEMRSLALTPTWSVATVLTIFVAVSLLVERSIHRLSNWLRKTHRNPLVEALEKMKEELMLLGFISLLLTATSRTISNICIDSKFYNGHFSPCTRDEVEDSTDAESDSPQDRKRLMAFVLHHSIKRALSELNQETCTEIHTWRKWEEEAYREQHDSEITRTLTMRRQSSFVKFHTSSSWSRNNFVVWMTCFLRQFGRSVVRADYLTLRRGFILNHHLTPRYDFHGYMIRSMEEEFKRIVGVSAPLWGFVVAFMLFNVNGSQLYFWIAIIPVALVLLVGAKLQHVIATLAWESSSLSGFGARLKLRDDLFWFKKPELLLFLIHFILFQNAFELASFFWFWWQFGYDSCFIRNHSLLYARLILGFAGQFLCSYSTLPLYALVTQMGSNYKAALIPQRIRETIHGWGKAARKRRKHRRGIDDSTIHTETSTVCSIEEDEELLYDPSDNSYVCIELQPTSTTATTVIDSNHSPIGDGHSNYSGDETPLLQSSVSVPSSPAFSGLRGNGISRSASMPIWRG
ncbi:MLO-like protein 14 isoform X2 [Phoenix dactylifera]|uniref:MLO-like protein n=1 Tax=Phoenix dactylifera TaxID=42345 RepID=A0A8B7BJI8_PHODC|nr:MLO-like protein 14 isoform X2 [Phoenix dactylifera]